MRRPKKTRDDTCRNGHSLADAFIDDRGRMVCRTCTAERTRERRARLKAEEAAARSHDLTLPVATPIGFAPITREMLMGRRAP